MTMQRVLPKDAATIMLVRDRRTAEDNALEVCMLKRHLDSDFVGGAYVFPGGKVDDADRGDVARDVCTGRSDEEASDLLGISSGGLAFWVAALRECFEEAGVLLAYGPGSDAAMIDVTDESVRADLSSLRHRLNARELEFIEACVSAGLSLAVDRVHYFSHWITPEPAPKRYDTRFFVAALPPGQVPLHDDYETVDTVWVEPARALQQARAGELDLIFPTMKNLQAISRFRSSTELLQAAAAIEQVPTIVPRVVSDDRGIRILLPGDPGYDEAIRAGAEQEGSDTSESADELPDGATRQVSVSEMSALIRSIDVDGVGRRETPGG